MCLYVQLDEACCRHKDDASIGGPLVLLSVWMMEHFSVGRPKVIRYDAWDDHDNPLRQPTWAYKWYKVSEFNGNQKRMYIDYTNEFDALTAEEVITAMSKIVIICLVPLICIFLFFSALFSCLA